MHVICSTKGNLRTICLLLGVPDHKITARFYIKVEAEMRGTLLLWSLLHGPGIVLASTIVTSISPDRIGYGGGTINIHGEGFATDGFSQFDPTKGNKVQEKRKVLVKWRSLRSSLPTLTRRWSAKILSTGTSSLKTLP